MQRLSNRRVLISTVTLSLGAGFATQGFAADADAIARSLQDPLANISAIITDNTFNLDMGGDEERTGYDFQIQPVHSLQTDRGFSIVPRGVIPGAFVVYNNTIAYDWSAFSGNEWTVPVGLHVGRAFSLSGGILLGGGFWERLKRAFEWQPEV